jgi:uncharacterized protein
MKLSLKKFHEEKLSITSLAFTVEFGLFILAVLWIIIRRIPVWSNIRITWEALILGIIAGILILAGGIIFYALDKALFDGIVRKTMETRVYPMFSNINPQGILVVALMSGICEELFFRGVLFTEFGIVVSSVIFGLLHTPGKKVWPLGLWTAFIGMIMALLYKATGNLFVPMVAHTFNNLVAISYVRYLAPEVKRQKMKISFKKDREEREKMEEPTAEAEYEENSEEEMTEPDTAKSIDKLKKDTADIIKFHAKEELSKAKKGLKEVAFNMADLAREFEDEFLRTGKRKNPETESAAQLLKSTDINSEKDSEETGSTNPVSEDNPEKQDNK